MHPVQSVLRFPSRALRAAPATVRGRGSDRPCGRRGTRRRDPICAREVLRRRTCTTLETQSPAPATAPTVCSLSEFRLRAPRPMGRRRDATPITLPGAVRPLGAAPSAPPPRRTLVADYLIYPSFQLSKSPREAPSRLPVSRLHRGRKTHRAAHRPVRGLDRGAQTARIRPRRPRRKAKEIASSVLEVHPQPPLPAPRTAPRPALRLALPVPGRIGPATDTGRAADRSNDTSRSCGYGARLLNI